MHKSFLFLSKYLQVAHSYQHFKYFNTRYFAAEISHKTRKKKENLSVIWKIPFVTVAVIKSNERNYCLISTIKIWYFHKTKEQINSVNTQYIFKIISRINSKLSSDFYLYLTKINTPLL